MSSVINYKIKNLIIGNQDSSTEIAPVQSSHSTDGMPELHHLLRSICIHNLDPESAVKSGKNSVYILTGADAFHFQVIMQHD